MSNPDSSSPAVDAAQTETHSIEVNGWFGDSTVVEGQAAELLMAQYAGDTLSETALPAAATHEVLCHDPVPAMEVGAVAAGAVNAESEPAESAVAASVIEPSEDAGQPEVAQAIDTEAPEGAPEMGTKKKSAPAEYFRDLDLSPDVQASIELAGYEKPTPIQARVIPHLLEGRDIVAQSETGSGKTAAFALPILTRLDMQKREPQVLVLTPTRELAIQVAKSFSTYGDALPRFSVAAIYGGQDYEIQLRQLRRGVQVIVGTPGRVIDHVHRGTLDLSKLDCLVLDEADEMLNMGFMEDVEFVLDQTPDHRQIALFSATMPGPIRDIAEESLNDPAKVTVKQKGATAESITQRAYFVPPREKIELLRRLLEVEDTDGVIVFTKTKESTLSVAEQLVRSGLRAVALNGDMPQSVRERAINQLKSGKLDILVATDVAARGLDVSRISHVVNFDLPHDSESYVHRVGRTGRAGREGTAFLFLTNAQRGKLRTIERATRQKIELAEMPTADAVNAKRIERFKNSITETTAEQDLTFFKELIAEYAEESGKPMDMIAAALAMIGTGGRNFLLKDRPKPKRSERSFDRDRDGGRPGGQRQRRDYERDDRRGALRPLEPGMNRYRVAVGRRDGVRPGNLVGAVANEAGIEGEYIGQIRIFDSYTMIDLPEGMPNDVYDTLQRTRVAGKPLRLKLADDDRGERRGPPHRKTHHKKPKHRKHKR